jgi:hypothetical protein
MKPLLFILLSALMVFVAWNTRPKNFFEFLAKYLVILLAGGFFGHAVATILIQALHK